MARFAMRQACYKRRLKARASGLASFAQSIDFKASPVRALINKIN
jgi:hypothetical protein